jgi:glycosyltransferase involved in cell wall biosynthesis
MGRAFFAPRIFTVNFDEVRILQISSAKTFGGGERHLVDLTRELRERGHEVFVGLRPTNEWQDRFDFLPPERFFHVSIRNSFGMFSANRISRFLAREKIDILHAHVARDYLAASVAAGRAKGVRLVLTRHVMFPMKPFHRFALRNVDAAIGVSPAVGGQLAKIFPKERVNIIANGITMDTASGDGDEFRSFHNIPADAPLVVTLGELRPLKGQRDLVLAAHEIVGGIPDCRFVVAGRDHTLDKKFRRELKRLAKVLGLEDNFLWLDWLDDISPLMAAADIFVSPSHSESFGLAILDAMAAGVPVVATATDGARELMGDTDTLVPIRDPLALAEKIRLYLEDDEKRLALGKTLQATARERFSLTRMVEATEALYTSLLP